MSERMISKVVGAELGAEGYHLLYDPEAYARVMQAREERIKSFVNVDGYDIPPHVLELILEDGMRPERVCAIAHLFESSEDYLSTTLLAESGQRDPRLDEVDAIWARLDEDEAFRHQSVTMH
jgi:hypothetical protein